MEQIQKSSVLIINRIYPFLLANVSFERKLVIMQGLLNDLWVSSFHSFKWARVYSCDNYSWARKENWLNRWWASLAMCPWGLEHLEKFSHWRLQTRFACKVHVEPVLTPKVDKYVTLKCSEEILSLQHAGVPNTETIKSWFSSALREAWSRAETHGQGNARAGHGEEPSVKDLEHQSVTFSGLAAQTALCAYEETEGNFSKIKLCLLCFIFIFVMNCLLLCEMCVCVCV